MTQLLPWKARAPPFDAAAKSFKLLAGSDKEKEALNICRFSFGGTYWA